MLICTYNGGRHITEQLQSIAAQTHARWHLVASDDGSTDDTVLQLTNFAVQYRDNVDIRDGPRKRTTDCVHMEPRRCATRNFLSLATDSAIKGDHFAYCDQDDTWMADKVECAVQWLSTIPPNVPALYCARSRLVRENGQCIGYSRLFTKPPSFRNALVQNLGGGNTMVFNRAGRDLIAAAANVEVVAHDWWTYLLLSGAGGVVHYDRVARVNYRQHASNLVGSNHSLDARAMRLEAMFDGEWAHWVDWNLKALRRAAHLLTPPNRHLLEQLGQRRAGSLVARLGMVTRLGLYRQTFLEQMGLGLAVVTNRL